MRFASPRWLGSAIDPGRLRPPFSLALSGVSGVSNILYIDIYIIRTAAIYRILKKTLGIPDTPDAAKPGAGFSRPGSVGISLVLCATPDAINEFQSQMCGGLNGWEAIEAWFERCPAQASEKGTRWHWNMWVIPGARFG
jgi:hypothetical protein